MKTPIIAIALLMTAVAGCLDILDPESSRADCDTSYWELGFDGENWPDLSHCQSLRVLSHSSYAAFDDAAGMFTNLTGADVELVERGDTGSALNVAVREAGAPQQHVIYGLDNAYLNIAIAEGILQPYQPKLSTVIVDEARFLPDTWYATPTDQGYVGINWDPDGPGMDNVTIDSLDDVAQHADKFVTQDPHTSSPGLGFMLITIGHYGEDGAYDWLDHWADLFDNGVLVTSGWSEAYEQHFSGGYGVFYGGLADKPIVNSYTESPAVEFFFGTPEEDLSNALVAPKTTWHQVQTTARLKDAGNQAVAEAWIEFTLTRDYQELAFANGVYPVIDGIDADAYYGAVDPEPGSFEPVDLDFQTVGDNIGDWLDEWNALCEQKDACA